MKGKRIFLFFCMIFVANYAFSQGLPLNPTIFKPSSHLPITNSQVNFLFNFNREVISPDFYSKNLGFFCRQEIKLESTIKFPVKFRLGSVQYCDWYEGKKGVSVKPEK